jgi:hypothetical protein
MPNVSTDWAYVSFHAMKGFDIGTPNINKASIFHKLMYFL